MQKCVKGLLLLRAFHELQYKGGTLAGREMSFYGKEQP